jgi:hypothetical protein
MVTLELSVSDAPNCDDSEGVIYATKVFNYAPKEHSQYRCHL